MNSGPIQQIPQGLLGFLQLKNRGQNPSELPDVLSPGFELSNWYLETGAEIVVQDAPVAVAVGTINLITVPNDQWWLVHDFFVNVGLDAGSTVFGCPVYRHGQAAVAATPMPLAEPRLFQFAVEGALALAPSTIVLPMFLPPGARLGFRATATSGAIAALSTAAARITRLRS